PTLLFVALFLGIPIIQAFYYSMTKWNGITTTWIGPSTFINEFKNPIFWRVMQNNALLLLAVPVAILIPMGIAFLLNEKVAGWRFFRSIYFLPTAISWVVIGMVAIRVFAQEGVLNQLLKAIGLGFIKTDLLSSEHGALLAVAITFIYSMVGTNTMIFLTGMANLDVSLNEAARIDGADNLRIFRSITLPQLKRFIQFSFIITVISAFTALFSLIFVMTGGGPGFGTTTLEFFVYQSAFAKGDFGAGAMLGFILFIIMAGLGAAQLAITRSKE
ncbi:MAG: sugar ABC transporter permease, partial [Actinobacteria bacterium]|nr:sugar ABC transporter permease [Candidatus Fonsibacter lacus]